MMIEKTPRFAKKLTHGLLTLTFPGCDSTSLYVSSRSCTEQFAQTCDYGTDRSGSRV